MPKCEVLNNIDHQNIKVITGYSQTFGDDVPNVPVFINEFSQLQKEYPLFFYKDTATNAIFPVAILGFDEKNLFLVGQEGNSIWDANYIPATRACGPFLIGFQNQWEKGDMKKNPVIHVDLENPRISFSEGEDVFLPMGGRSDYLNKVTQALELIHSGITLNRDFIDACVALDLIEPVKLEVSVDDVHEYRISGYYTINREKLYALGAKILEEFHRSGYLESAYYMLASVSNVSGLIDRMNKFNARK